MMDFGLLLRKLLFRLPYIIHFLDIFVKTLDLLLRFALHFVAQRWMISPHTFHGYVMIFFRLWMRNLL